MSSARETDGNVQTETLLEMHLHVRLGSQVRHLRILSRDNGVILQGSACTYYAQHSVMEMTDLPILANEIEVG